MAGGEDGGSDDAARAARSGESAEERASRIEAEYVEATRRGEERARTEPVAVSARYDRGRGRVVVVLASGLEVAFAPRDVQGLERATGAQLATIEVSPAGQGLHFPALDADVWLPGLLEGVFGSRAWMASRGGAGAAGARGSARRDDRSPRRGRRRTPPPATAAE